MMFRPLPFLTIATLIALAVLIGLGTWQVQRMVWKDDLNTAIKARVTAPASPLPPMSNWADMDIDGNEYRPFRVRGTFDHEREVHAFTVLSSPKGKKSGPGYWVLTPLALEGGGTVLINRGFVPEDAKDLATRPAGAVLSPVEITGLLRQTILRARFVPEPNLAGNVWFARDVAAMAAWRNVTDVAPFFLDAADSAPGGLPQGGETRLEFRNNHFDYALTWYGLAIVLVAFYFAFHHAAGRLGRVKGKS